MDNFRPTSPPRVAVTLEQCWHAVPGGTATYALEVTRALAGRADVVGVSAWHRHQAPAAWRPGVPVRALPLPRKALYAAWGGTRRPKVQLATGAVDVVHAVTFAVPPRSAPLVVTVHDLAFRRDPAHSTRRGLAFFERGLAQTRAEAGLVLCPSMTTLEDCERAGIGTDRLRHTPLGVRVPDTSPAAVAGFRRRHALERPYVLRTGTVEPRKNLPTLLAAFALLAQTPAGRDLDLVLVGPSGWGQVSQAKFKVAPWDEAYGELPEGMHLGITHWGADEGFVQQCAAVSGEAIEEFVVAHPYTDSPEPNAQ